MVFSTVLFLFRFLPITLALYYLAPARLKNTVLFLCSLVFYSGALGKIVDDVLANNPKAVADYKDGKTNVAGFLVGQCMKASRGQGNPGVLREMLLSAIEKL